MLQPGASYSGVQFAASGICRVIMLLPLNCYDGIGGRMVSGYLMGLTTDTSQLVASPMLDSTSLCKLTLPPSLSFNSRNTMAESTVSPPRTRNAW